MKLAKYLTDYIEHERVSRDYGYIGACELEKIIQRGLEVFAKTEGVTIEVMDTDGFQWDLFSGDPIVWTKHIL